MTVNIENIISTVSKLGAVYNSHLSYLVLMAYDIEQLIQLISNNQDIRNKFLNFLSIPSLVLNEKAQARKNVLKQFISEDNINQNTLYSSETLTEHRNSTIKYICFDNILIAIKKINSIMCAGNKTVQIVVADSKIRKLIKCHFGVKNQIRNIKNIENKQTKKIIKILNDIVVDKVTVGNITISDISNLRFDCDLTILLDINPSTAWSNNIGHLLLSGCEREVLGLTTRIDWQNLLTASPEICIFSKQADLPLWQSIHSGNIEYVTTTYPQLHDDFGEAKELQTSNLKTELTVKANSVSDLLYNPYLFYLKNILDLKPKKYITDDISKIFYIFGRLLNTETEVQQLSELKDIDYFYYKKIHSFIKQIPHQQTSHEHITINGLTVVYKHKQSEQIASSTEINYYTLLSAIPSKDIINGCKTDLMVQALSINADTVKFNVISPDWHSRNGVNKRSIELSKGVLDEYKNNIETAWSDFMQSDVFKLKFDKDKASSLYRHLERVQQ